MEGGFWVVIGMSIAYGASLIGMILAWVSYRRRRKSGDVEQKAAEKEKE